MDLVQLTRNPPHPPATPLMWTMFLFLPLFYRSFPIFRHNFYIKSKKKYVKSGLARNPPPHCGLNPSKCFFIRLENESDTEVITYEGDEVRSCLVGHVTSTVNCQLSTVIQ